MAAMDLLGRRWSLRIMWELRDGPLGARALRERCDEMSSSILYTRLGELVAARLVEQDESDRYQLTELGCSLRSALDPLVAWADEWSKEMQR